MTKKPSGPNGEFALLVDAIQDYAIFLLSPEGEVRTWNSGAIRIMGYEANEALGRHFSLFYPADVVAWKPRRELEIAAETGRVEDEGWRIRKDGTQFWANTTITALRTADGKIHGFAKVTRDLTERRNADERLRQSEEMFRLLVQSVKEYAVFMLDPEGRIVTWNLGAQRIKGYTREEIVGKHFSIFYPEEDIITGKVERELVIAKRDGVLEDEGWRVRKDGSRFFADVVITAIYADDGDLKGFAKVTRDISERRRAEEIRNALLEQREARLRAEEAKRHAESSFLEAQETNRAKDEFLMTLSHELRTPLTSILGWARLLPTMSASDPSFRTALEAIGRSAQVQARLLDDVLETSRIISGKLRLNIEPTEIAGVVGDAVQSVAAAAQAKQIRLDLHVEPDIGPVSIDPTRLQQILWNLLANAIKFTPAGGTVSLKAWRSGETLDIEVSDTGEGIAPEFLPHMFEPFRQAEQSSTRIHGGLGLGLAIVRYLVEAHGGRIAASSSGDGEGSTFRVEIPIRAQASNDPSLPRQTTWERSGQQLAGLSILVLDDDRDSREYVRLALERASADVEEATSAREALEAVERHRPDLIIADLALPEIDGYEFVRLLRGREAAPPPVIALSAFPRQTARPSGVFSAYLNKPIEPEELVTAVSRFAGRAQAAG